MSSFAQVTLVGNLGQDPKVLETQEENPKKENPSVRISLAINRSFKTQSGEVRKVTDWHTVYFTNALAKIVAERVKKGEKILVSGELRNRKWKDSHDIVHYSTDVLAREMRFLTPKTKTVIPDLSEEEIASYDTENAYSSSEADSEHDEIPLSCV